MIFSTCLCFGFAHPEVNSFTLYKCTKLIHKHFITTKRVAASIEYFISVMLIASEAEHGHGG